VQVVLYGRFAEGVRVKLVAGLADCVNALGLPDGHSNVKALLVALTDSLKLIVMVEVTATPVAPFNGELLVMLGAASTGAATT
jgi:hypothetical protein